MIVAKQSRSPAAAAWQLEFARLIAFPAESALNVDQHWWQDLAGSPPEDFVPTRKIHFRDDRGSFQGVLLSSYVDVHRIAWEIRSPRVVDESGMFPVLGAYREKLGWFVDFLSPWLTNLCPPLIRLALSAKMLQPAASVDEAYRVLTDHLPAIDLKKYESYPNDFVLQINRRKPTSEVVKGLPINRVCTWSKMNVPVVLEHGKPFQWPEQCYSALEFDINTAPENTETLPRTLLSPLLRELAALGRSIADYGDIP